MDVSQAIRRLSIHATTSGVSESTKQLNDLARAQGGVAVASATTEKATLSADAAFQKLERRYQTANAQQAAFEKTQRLVNAAVAQNPALQERAVAVLAAAADRHNLLTKAANDNAAAAGLNRQQLAQLGSVAKNAFASLAAGEAPLKVLGQEGRAAAAALSNEGSGLGSGLKNLAALLGPGGVIAAGLIAAGAAAALFYETFKQKAPTAETLLNEHNRLLGLIKASYDAASDSASRFYDQSREVTKVQLLQQQLDLQQKLQESVTTTLKNGPLKLTTGDSGFEYVVKSQFKAFEDALADLNESWQKGVPNVRAFMDEVARITLLNPALQKAGAELIASFGDANKFATALKQVGAALKLLDGGNLTGEERGRLGLPDAQRQEVSAYDMLIQRTKDRIEELKLEAETAGQTADAVIKLKLQHDAERAAKKAGVEVNQAQLDQLKEELALRERLKNLAQLDANIKFDKETLGLSPEDLQIAQRLRGAFNSVGEALKSPQAEQIRLNNLFRDGREIVAGFGNDLAAGLLRGQNAMQSLTAAASNLISKLSSKTLNEFLRGGDFFGKQDLASAQGGVTIASAGLAGYQSGNLFTGALGGALAGAAFGPAGAAIGGIVGAIGGLIGQSANAEKELQAAQERWRGMTTQVDAFNRAAAGFNVGPLTSALAKRPANDNKEKEEDRNDRDERRQVA